MSGTGFGDSPVALRPQRQRCSQLVRNATEPNKDDRTKVAVAGQNVPLRQEKPKLWLAFLAANLSVYAAGIFIALTVSNEASNEFFLSLAKINSEVRSCIPLTSTGACVTLLKNAITCQTPHPTASWLASLHNADT